jgi:hypothetical protein
MHLFARSLVVAMAALAPSPLLGSLEPSLSTSPIAQVLRTTVEHQGNGIRVHVPSAATYVGSERFILYGAADAEVHVFVEADGQRRVRRFYWIQFENFLPTFPDRHFNYADGNRREIIWGWVTWTVGGPRLTKNTGRPGSDHEHIMRIISRAGYTVPQEMMNARLVQLLDDPEGTGKGRSELMLIYSEDLDPSGKRYAELVANDQTTHAWEPLERPLIRRAAAAFLVERLKPQSVAAQ